MIVFLVKIGFEVPVRPFDIFENETCKNLTALSRKSTQREVALETDMLTNSKIRAQ